MPLSAVTFGGHDTVSSESTTATSGRKNGLRHETLICFSVSVKTAAAETSDPVPAVVGTQMSGVTGPGTRQSPV